MSSTDRIHLFGYEIDVVNMSQAVDRIRNWIAKDVPCRMVVTPNVDHTVMLQSSHSLAAAYEEADMILADGWPVVWAAKLLGKPLPGRVAGSDLVPALFDSTNEPFCNDSMRGHATKNCDSFKVFLLGAAPGVPERAAKQIHNRWPSVKVVGTYSPPLGFEKSGAQNVKILKKIAFANPDILIVGLGAPKQELWVHRHRHVIRANVALCAGATIDFIAGEKKRAPKLVQAANCEWLYRLVSEPRRLWKRYAHDAIVFPQLLAREWIRS